MRHLQRKPEWNIATASLMTHTLPTFNSTDRKNQVSQITCNKRELRILVVDDEESTRFTIGAVLRRDGYQVELADSIEQATRVLEESDIDLIIADLRIGSDSGLTLIKLVNSRFPQTEAILMTEYGSIENAVEAIQTVHFLYPTDGRAADLFPPRQGVAQQVNLVL